MDFEIAYDKPIRANRCSLPVIASALIFALDKAEESSSFIVERSRKMPNMIFEQVTEYKASICSGSDKEANIVLLTANSNIYLYFYKEGVQLRENRSSIHGGRQHVYLYFHYNHYPNMIDLLRNEKPINVFYRDDFKLGYLTTSMEPVGENEFED